jgi:hypothetical protein
MTDIASVLPSASLGQVPAPTSNPNLAANPTLASAGIPPGGVHATATPGAKAEPFSKRERVSIDAATKDHAFNDKDASRWGHLERMSVNLGTTRPNDSAQLKWHVETLRNKLSGYSNDVSAYGKHVERLQADPWSKVPFSSVNRELSWARNALSKATNNLNNMRDEIDAFLSRPDSLPYYRNAIDQPRR